MAVPPSSVWCTDTPNLNAPTGEPAIQDLIYHYYLNAAGYAPLFAPRPDIAAEEPKTLPKD